jgi:hypothetical protein
MYNIEKVCCGECGKWQFPWWRGGLGYGLGKRRLSRLLGTI